MKSYSHLQSELETIETAVNAKAGKVDMAQKLVAENEKWDKNLEAERAVLEEAVKDLEADNIELEARRKDKLEKMTSELEQLKTNMKENVLSIVKTHLCTMITMQRS